MQWCRLKSELILDYVDINNTSAASKIRGR